MERLILFSQSTLQLGGENPLPVGIEKAQTPCLAWLCIRGSDLVLLWLWCGLAAVTLVIPLASWREAQGLPMAGE